MRTKLFLYFCLVLNSYITHAASDADTSKPLATEDKFSSNTSSAKKLTKHEKSLAKQFMLSEADYQKYKEIMSGPRGVWSPELDPITALGVSETDPQKRKKYAEIWVKVESKRMELEIAFEVERMAASKRVFGDKLAFNNTSWIEQWKNEQNELTKKIYLFIDHDCTKKCKSLIEELRHSISKTSRLDIYFQTGATSENIAEWASYMKISPETVKKRIITLNFDQGKSASLGVNMSDAPQVLVHDLKSNKVSKSF